MVQDDPLNNPHLARMKSTGVLGFMSRMNQCVQVNQFVHVAQGLQYKLARLLDL